MPQRTALKDAEDPRPRIRAGFRLFGDALEPERCTQLLGMAPTASGRRGDTPSGRRRPFPETFWEIVLDRRAYDLDEVVSELVRVLAPHRGAIETVRAGGAVDAEVSCAVELYAGSIVLNLRERSIAALAELRVAFGLDMFDYRDASDAQAETS